MTVGQRKSISHISGAADVTHSDHHGTPEFDGGIIVHVFERTGRVTSKNAPEDATS